MKRLALAVLWVACVGASAWGAPQSAPCSRALDLLREQEDRVIAAPRDRVEAARQRMLQARRAAALACLGEGGDQTSPRPARTEGPPAAPPRAQPTRTPRPSPVPPAVPAPPLPRTLGACDSNGCWTSDGLRLQRAGPQLLGPNGFCSVAGTAVHCP